VLIFWFASAIRATYSGIITLARNSREFRREFE